MGGFMATADPIGLCPVTALTASGASGLELGSRPCDLLGLYRRRARRDGPARPPDPAGRGARIDVLLAEKFAGAATATGAR
jgi:hypothetical protein